GALLVITAIAAGIGNLSFNRTFKSKVERLLKNHQQTKNAKITEADIKDLPAPVQKYLHYTGIIGKERVATVRLRQKGAMRLKPGGKWIPLEAEEYYAVDNPGFVWRGQLAMAPLLTVSAHDIYLDGTGNMHIKLLSVITLVDAKGKEMDEASLMRYLNEMIWFPSALVGDKVKWEPIDEHSARATMTDHGITVSAVFYFDDEGRVINFVAERGRDAGGGKLVKTKWSTPLTSYKTFKGLRLPNKGNAVWHLESGEYSYIELEITDVEYNNPTLY
ncbi:MAG TPA: DUF6544 family protein, partial [Anaerolineae bacterium]|nr:DUF6544 family protein [Anaerolineae bacterium]